MPPFSTRPLPLIVLSQFLCTSLWFAGNAVIPNLASLFHFPENVSGHISSAVQLGFITGTFVYAFFSLADRFRPSRVFFLSAVAASLSNIFMLMGREITDLLICRFLTGFFLAGIYPVGMRIAADHYEKGLGKALGFLVGALVLGTGFPHLLNSLPGFLSWKTVIISTSVLSLLGGLVILLLVPDGPYRKTNQQLDPTAIFKVFSDKAFRSVSFGYFGHMWELYSFWTFIPLILKTYHYLHPENALNIPLLSFLIIASGFLSCIGSGYISVRWGAAKTAFVFLLLSGICCILSPLAFYLPLPLFIVFLLIWGLAVIADSPMFSTLVAQSAPPASKGTALTIVTCIGFAVTILSIQLINILIDFSDVKYLFIILGIGPILGLLCIRNTFRKMEQIRDSGK
jgi:MFS family permease